MAFDISVEQTMRSRLRKNGIESSRIQGEQEVENNSNPRIKYHLCNANISIKYITRHFIKSNIYDSFKIISCIKYIFLVKHLGIIRCLLLQLSNLLF